MEDTICAGKIQVNGDAVNPRFTGVLYTIAIAVFPDKITQLRGRGRRSPVAEILAPIIGVWRQGKS